jgi:hypothetical protein
VPGKTRVTRRYRSYIFLIQMKFLNQLYVHLGCLSRGLCRTSPVRRDPEPVGRARYTGLLSAAGKRHDIWRGRKNLKEPGYDA